MLIEREATHKVIEYLCSPEGKADYRARLEYWKSTCPEGENEIIWDRMPDYALNEITEIIGMFTVDSDLALDHFGTTLSRLDRDGYPVQWSTLPRIIARVSRVDTMTEKLGAFLERCQDEN